MEQGDWVIIMPITLFRRLVTPPKKFWEKKPGWSPGFLKKNFISNQADIKILKTKSTKRLRMSYNSMRLDNIEIFQIHGIFLIFNKTPNFPNFLNIFCDPNPNPKISVGRSLAYRVALLYC